MFWVESQEDDPIRDFKVFVQEGHLDYVPYEAGSVTDCPDG